MTKDTHKVMAVYEAGPYIEVDLMDYSYEGPRGLTIRLTGDDAVFLLDALAEAYDEVPVPKGSIVFTPERSAETSPNAHHLRLVNEDYLNHLRDQVPPPSDYELPECDGYCADCNHTCPNRAHKTEGSNTVDTSGWCLWHSEPLPLGHTHRHQKEGS